MSGLIKRFLKYVSFDTMSSEISNDCPSTEGQMALANELKEELKSLGLSNISLDENGYVMATLLSNTDKDVPVIGLIAHMDTSSDMSGKNIKARIVEKYDGGDILLNEEKKIYLKVSDYPELARYEGEDIIVTDGTTLLGADDKAGIAEIMTAVENLINHPEILHGEIKIAFTPDEEIGRGADKFDVKKFGAKYAYTVDGGQVGELEYETFNAASGKVTVHGLNIHPGSAKGKMKNSILIANEFISMLPAAETPGNTENREGFFHLDKFIGSIEETKLTYIIRDHDMRKFIDRKDLFAKTADYLNMKHGKGTVEIELKDSYYNMREKIEPVMFIVDIAASAIDKIGIKPIIKPVRGGTDGSRLSFMGLPTPNIFTGGHNYHGRFEYIPIGSMEKAVEVITNIVEAYTEL